MLWKHPTLLLVDDDEVAVMAFERAIAQQKISIPVLVARDGDEALEILGDPGRLKAPYVVILDLNMPRMSGHELLEIIRSDPDLKGSVVFVLTTSDDPQDIARAYDKNVAGYVVKEDAYRSIGTTVALLNAYIQTVALPDRNFVKT